MGWESEILVAVQSVRNVVFDVFFVALTSMGDKEFLILLFAALFWCVDHVVGLRLAFAYLLGTYGVVLSKDLIGRPRPDEAFRLVDADEVNGLPSGHSMAALFLGGIVAARLKKRWVWGVAALVAILMGISRVYVGVHFPLDVLAGWAMGIGFLLLYLWLGPRLETWLVQARLVVQLALAVALPALLILAAAATGSSTSAAALMAALMGAGVGAALAQRVARFETAGPLWQRMVRFLVGAVPLVGIVFGLKLVFPGEEAPLLYGVTRFLRYLLAGLWVGLGAPWVFLALRLAPRKPSS